MECSGSPHHRHAAISPAFSLSSENLALKIISDRRLRIPRPEWKTKWAIFYSDFLWVYLFVCLCEVCFFFCCFRHLGSCCVCFGLPECHDLVNLTSHVLNFMLLIRLFFSLFKSWSLLLFSRSWIHLLFFSLFKSYSLLLFTYSLPFFLCTVFKSTFHILFFYFNLASPCYFTMHSFINSSPKPYKSFIILFFILLFMYSTTNGINRTSIRMQRAVSVHI